MYCRFKSILSFVSVIASGMYLWNCSTENETRATLTQQNILLQRKIDSLQIQVAMLRHQGSSGSVTDQHKDLLSELDIRFLKRQGLENPVEQIKADLVQNNTLIPVKGTMGGTMRFYEDQIQILNCNWV